MSVKTMRLNMTVQVETLDYDAKGNEISIKGRNVEEGGIVKFGAYHTIKLVLNHKFTVYKDEWDSVALDLIEQSIDVTRKADVAAVIMQEGLAHVCLITNYATLVRAKIEMNIPNKRKGSAALYDKAFASFLDQIAQAIEKHIRFDVVKCVILASPGLQKEAVFNHIKKLATCNENKVFQENKHKFVLVHASTGHIDSLKEVMTDPAVKSLTANTKAAQDIKLLDDFNKMLKYNPSRAFYGVNHIMYAHESEAIDTLLISDSLFRSKNHSKRKRFVNLVDSVKENQGTVRIFSSSHFSGGQLDALSGIAAILRFPLLDPENDEENDEVDNKF